MEIVFTNLSPVIRAIPKFLTFKYTMIIDILRIYIHVGILIYILK